MLYHFTREKSDIVCEFWNIKTPSTRIRFRKELTASKTYIYIYIFSRPLYWFEFRTGACQRGCTTLSDDVGCLPERLLLSVRTKSINEKLWIENYAHCCFCNYDSTYFSILSLRGNALYDCYSRIVDSFLFIN